MPSLDKVKSVVDKILSIEGIGEHISFFGGTVPYLYHGKESNRDHSDIDILVDADYMDQIRTLLQENDLYNPDLDSLNLDLDKDYGVKAFINGVYVEFEPITIENNMFTRASFSPEKSLAGTEAIPFTSLEDIIVPFEIDGVKTRCESMEMLLLGKEQYKREKDLQDIDFIKENGIDYDRCSRVQDSLENANVSVSSYERLRNKNSI